MHVALIPHCTEEFGIINLTNLCFLYLVTVASGNFSVVYIRATTILSRLTSVTDKSYQVALTEGAVSKLANNGIVAYLSIQVLQTIPLSRSGIQTVNCQLARL